MIAAVVATYWRHLLNLERCLSLIRPEVDMIVCSYIPQNRTDCLPASICLLCDYIIYHRTPGQYQGEIASTKAGFLVASLYADHIMKINGDTFITKPEGIKGLVTTLGDYDMVAPQWHVHHHIPSLLIFFGKAKPLADAYKDVYCHDRLPQLERKWFEQIEAHKLKLKIVPMDPGEQHGVAKSGYWAEQLGIRHIHGEYSADG